MKWNYIITWVKYSTNAGTECLVWIIVCRAYDHPTATSIRKISIERSALLNIYTHLKYMAIFILQWFTIKRRHGWLIASTWTTDVVIHPHTLKSLSNPAKWKWTMISTDYQEGLGFIDCISCAHVDNDDVIKLDHFRVTGSFCGEFTGHRWIPLTKASDAELWGFRWYAPEQSV